VSGSGLPLPAARGGSDQTVAFAAELIERSGKAPVTTMHVSPASGVPARLADQGSGTMTVAYVPGGLPRPAGSG
jgi:hypothetical protein